MPHRRDRLFRRHPYEGVVGFGRLRRRARDKDFENLEIRIPRLVFIRTPILLGARNETVTKTYGAGQ